MTAAQGWLVIALLGALLAMNARVDFIEFLCWIVIAGGAVMALGAALGK